MDRKSFFKNACGLGVCSCLGAELLSTNNLYATEPEKPDWKEGFVKYRYAKLIGILDSTLDEKTRNKILESLGKECAMSPHFSKNYINNPEGFLKEIKNKFGENAIYDKERQFIRIESPERDCVCPLVDSKIISKTVCQCSVGWQTQTYNTIFGKDVLVKCVESIVKGNKRCVFEIQVQAV